MANLTKGIKEKYDKTKIDMRIRDNTQLGIEVSALNKKERRLIQIVESQQTIFREHQIELTTLKKEESVAKAANQEQLIRLKELNSQIQS